MKAWHWAAAAAVSLTFFGTATAQDAGRPHLVSTIDAATFSDRFPVVALARGVSGRVVLNCNVAADGSSQCTSTEETPAGMGFGAAATSLAQGWRFTPRMENGQAVAGNARIPIVFRNPASDSVPIAPDIYVDAPTGAANLSAASGVDALARFYPQRARQSSASGRALVSCAVRTGPRLECAPERESPSGWGFGDAAASAAAAELGRQPLHPGDRTRVAVDFATHPSGLGPTPRQFWETTPSGDDALRYYPGRALDAHRSGRALLNCTIAADRTLANCMLVSETPRDWGFGDGAVQLSRRYRLAVNELGRPGHSVGDHILMPIIFSLPS